MAAPAVFASLIPLFVVAAIRRAEERIHRQLVEGKALAAETAISVTLGRSFDARRLQALVEGGAVRRTATGLHFLDADGWNAHESRRRRRVVIALCVVLGLIVVGAVVFFTLFEQAGSSMNLFADRNTQLPEGFSAAQTQSFNAGFILLFAPLFAIAWTWLAKRNLDPDPVVKFGLGLLQVGLGFLVLVWAAGSADADYRMPLVFLALAYLLHTTGELCLSPVGLSEITKLSVPALVSTMMAIWFLSSSWAQYLGAFIAEQAGTETIGGQVVDPRAALDTSIGVFNAIGWVGVSCGIFFFLLSAILKRRRPA